MTDTDLVHLFEREIPFNAHLGIRVDRLDQNRTIVRLPNSPHVLGDAGAGRPHSGALMALAETAASLHVLHVLGSDEQVVMLDMRVDFLAPGRRGDLLALAHIVRLGERFVRVGVNVTSDSTDLDDPQNTIAHALGVFSILRG